MSIIGDAGAFAELRAGRLADVSQGGGLDLLTALADRANTKVHRVGATKGSSEQALRGREAVTMLNAVISKQFARDKTFLAAWLAAQRVVAKPGVARMAAAPLGAVAPAAATTLASVPVAAPEPVVVQPAA